MRAGTGSSSTHARRHRKLRYARERGRRRPTEIMIEILIRCAFIDSTIVFFYLQLPAASVGRSVGPFGRSVGRSVRSPVEHSAISSFNTKLVGQFLYVCQVYISVRLPASLCPPCQSVYVRLSVFLCPLVSLSMPVCQSLSPCSPVKSVPSWIRQ